MLKPFEVKFFTHITLVEKNYFIKSVMLLSLHTIFFSIDQGTHYMSKFYKKQLLYSAKLWWGKLWRIECHQIYLHFL